MEATLYPSQTITGLAENIITRSYNEYHPFVVNYIANKINNRFEAEDLAHDVFMRLLDYKQMIREETVRFLIFTIARNIVIDHIRMHVKKQEVSANMYEFLEKSNNDFESKLYEKEILQLEQSRLSTFPSKRKIVYSLHRYEELSIPEISETLKISRSTVENHLFVGRKIIREYIRECV